MFRQRAPGTPNRHGIKLALALLAAAGMFFAVQGHGLALSNIGPDPTDFGGTPGIDRFGYIVTSQNYAPASIPETMVPLYYPDNIGNKTITIEDPNLCIDTRQSAPAGGDYMDNENAPNANGARAAAFFVHSLQTGQDSNFQYSVVDNSTTCDSAKIILTFPGSLLHLDTSNNLYTIEFHAAVDPAINQAENRFRIILSQANAIVGMSSQNVSSQGAVNMFGTAKISPTNNGAGRWNNYHLPFAPDCSITDPNGTEVQAIMYDLDNGDKNIQGGVEMQISVDDDTAGAKVPLQFWQDPNKATPWAASGGPGGYIVNTPNAKFVYITFNVFPKHLYHFDVSQVYFVNILQFQLPFDSINYDFPCTTPTPTPPPPVFQPTVSVTGGDVVAGAAFQAVNSSGAVVACPATPDTNAGVATWNQDNAPAYTGSGVSLAAYALNQIQDFPTSQGHSPPTTLSFANDGNNGSTGSTGYFGGMFGSSSPWCVDFWSKSTTATPLGGASLNSLGAGDFNYFVSAPGGFTIPNVTIDHGEHLTLYVDGDVYIKHNIVYQTGAAWTDPLDIPNFRLVVHGSIFIDSNSDQLDGTYVAVPDAGYEGVANDFSAPIAGTISTCSSGIGASYNPLDGGSYYADCKQKTLTVNGSFVANQIWLLRTAGDLSNATHAETFNYGPEVWLAPSGGNIGPVKYDAVSGLPPVL